METFLDTFSGGGTGGGGFGGGGFGGGANPAGGGGTDGGYQYDFSNVDGTGGGDDLDGLFQESPFGSLSEVGITSFEQVFRGNTGGNLARDDDNAASGGGDTSDDGIGGGDTSGGGFGGGGNPFGGGDTSGGGFGGGGNPFGGAGNPSAGGDAGNSPEIAAPISETVSYAIENQRPLTDEESQKLAEDVSKLIEDSIDIAGFGEAESSTSGDAPTDTDITGFGSGDSTNSGDALLSGGAGDNSTSSGFSLRSGIDSYFISDEFSSNFAEVPNYTGTDSVLPISGSSFGGGDTGGGGFGGGGFGGGDTGGGGFGGGGFGGGGIGGGGNPPSDDLFGSSPWGRLEEVGISSFSDVFGGGAASGGNPSGGV